MTPATFAKAISLFKILLATVSKTIFLCFLVSETFDRSIFFCFSMLAAFAKSNFLCFFMPAIFTKSIFLFITTPSAVDKTILFQQIVTVKAAGAIFVRLFTTQKVAKAKNESKMLLATATKIIFFGKMISAAGGGPILLLNLIPVVAAKIKRPDMFILFAAARTPLSV